MNKHISIIAFIFLVSGLIIPAQAIDSASSVLAEAKKLFKKAGQLQGAWISTGKLIKKADAAMKKDDKTTALKLATRAKKEAQQSITQAEDQLKNWSEPPYIRN